MSQIPEEPEGWEEYYKKLLEEQSEWKELVRNVKRMQRELKEKAAATPTPLTPENVVFSEEEMKFLFDDSANIEKYLNDLNTYYLKRRLLILKMKHVQNAQRIRAELFEKKKNGKM